MVTSESAVILSLSRKALNNLLGRRDDSAGAALGLTPEDASFATSALKKSPALGGLRQAHHKMLAGVSASLLAGFSCILLVYAGTISACLRAPLAFRLCMLR